MYSKLLQRDVVTGNVFLFRNCAGNHCRLSVCLSVGFDGLQLCLSIINMFSPLSCGRESHSGVQANGKTDFL